MTAATSSISHPGTSTLQSVTNFAGNFRQVSALFAKGYDDNLRIIDTGATDHMAPALHLFDSLMTLAAPISIHLPTGNIYLYLQHLILIVLPFINSYFTDSQDSLPHVSSFSIPISSTPPSTSTDSVPITHSSNIHNSVPLRRSSRHSSKPSWLKDFVHLASAATPTIVNTGSAAFSYSGYDNLSADFVDLALNTLCIGLILIMREILAKFRN
ncbi:hypothetical protein GH714_011893 [Hevea brasiliensis]|uniref:Uncharacterized protein n=1 Tax=Hevea brasiliensis TaxID=3981 RepID=A0A6A6NGP6_HEVBR|nr:hypothetical protein GH714_011893 [Hevea brasiliensis]